MNMFARACLAVLAVLALSACLYKVEDAADTRTSGNSLGLNIAVEEINELTLVLPGDFVESL